jgi:hypothetical protein
MREVVLVFMTLLVEKSFALSRCDLKGIVQKYVCLFKKLIPYQLQTYQAHHLPPSLFLGLKVLLLHSWALNVVIIVFTFLLLNFACALIVAIICFV